MEQVQRLLANLRQLGARKLAALGTIGLVVFAITGVAGYILSRPSMELLYAGLDRQDVSSIGAALRDADIPFDVSSDGASVLVRYGQTAPARMLLAEKGLPHSTNAGYELYDKMGSLGLTSFMQDVTRVRALEGELARTIQSMSGVKAARVHVVLPDQGSFRRVQQPASASVVIRAATVEDNRTAQAIRHLVAAAVPGMKIDEVTVLSTDGAILASGDDSSNAAPGRMLDLEKLVGSTIQDNIRRTLAPSLGLSNVQISVAARLNTDTRQVAETVFNPDGRVERSTRTVKENQSTQNSTAPSSASVTQNVPQAKAPASDGKQSNEETQKKEDLTNYEVSSKTTTTMSSAGYGVEHLSVAVVSSTATALADIARPEGQWRRDRSQAPGRHRAIGGLIGRSSTRRGATPIKIMADRLRRQRPSDLEPAPSPGVLDAAAPSIRHADQCRHGARSSLSSCSLFAVRPLTRVPSRRQRNCGRDRPGLGSRCCFPIGRSRPSRCRAADRCVMAAPAGRCRRTLDEGEPNL